MAGQFLGKSGVRVSPLCLGTMSFGNEASPEVSAQLFRIARESGINIFDTADVYSAGESERILGKLIADCRDEIVLATKAYFPTGPDRNARGLSRYHIVRAVEASLKRLNTEYIDIFYLHRHDDETAIEETWRAIDDLVRAGKILYPALSNFSAWQGMKATSLCRSRGWAAPICFQPMYNLAKRQAEVEILPMCLNEEIGVMPYSPTGGGLLTGKYGATRRPDSGRLLDSKMYEVRYGSQSNFELAERFTALSEKYGHEPAALAIAWVAAHPAVSAPIVGTRSPAHLQVAIGSLDIELTYDSELYREIASLSTTPPPATDRNEEVSAHNFGSR
ncbi:MAG: aldo/keto reductase [Kofleriaceae bacterium]|nr:aldo/keto reductase [Kofleriaceae bacterium]